MSYKFRGGVHPNPNKELSKDKPFVTLLPKGEMVYKYGEIIGETLQDIPQGGWVSHENIRSIPRDYASEYIMGKEGK